MNIFNVKAISKKIEERKQFPNLYQKLYYAFKGASDMVSLEMIDEVEKTVDAEVKELKKSLKIMREKVTQEN